MHWLTSRFTLDLTRPHVMGIVNLTPDSFSDGGQHATPQAALRHCERLLREGADILDLGAESTRPGAQALGLQEELDRLLPVVREAVRLQVPISVDTYKPEVMQAALEVGADIVNDIWALRWRSSPAGLTGQQVVSAHPRCGVCLMHMHGEPRTMQASPMEGDVLPQVRAFLKEAAHALQAQGVAAERIVLDPGVGFGKTVDQNLALLARQSELLDLGHPLLVGWSRKSSLGRVIGETKEQMDSQGAHPRRAASVAAALLAVERGARIVRVHDVADTVQALKVLDAIKHVPAGTQHRTGTLA